MNKFTCPKCKLYSFPTANSLVKHLNKCSISFVNERHVYHPHICVIDELDDNDSNQNRNKINKTSNIGDVSYEFNRRLENSNLTTTNNNNYGIEDHHIEDSNDLNNYDFNDREENDNSLFTTKYYNWQLRLGEILFSGSKRKNNTSDITVDNSSNHNNSSELSTITHVSSSSTLTGLGSVLKLGRVKDVSGLFFGIPDVNDVIDIFTFAKLNMLSHSSGDELLHLLKEIIRRHSSTVEKYFIYDRIENLNGAVTRAVSQIYQGVHINITLPTKLCGDTPQEMDNIKRILDYRNRNLEEYIIAKGNGLNVVELISEFLINISINDFDFHPITLKDDDNQISYGRFATGDLFAHIYHEVSNQYGHDVIPVCVQLSFDGTDISGGGGSKPRSSTPFHVRVLNVSDDVFGLQMSTILCGFAPTFTVSSIYLFVYVMYFYSIITVFVVYFEIKIY